MPAYKPRFTVHYLKSLLDKAGKLTAVESAQVEQRVAKCGAWNNCGTCKLKIMCRKYYDKL